MIRLTRRPGAGTPSQPRPRGLGPGRITDMGFCKTQRDKRTCFEHAMSPAFSRSGLRFQVGYSESLVPCPMFKRPGGGGRRCPAPRAFKFKFETASGGYQVLAAGPSLSTSTARLARNSGCQLSTSSGRPGPVPAVEKMSSDELDFFCMARWVR